MELDDRLVAAARELLVARWPGSGGLAAAAYTRDGGVLTSVVFDPESGRGRALRRDRGAAGGASRPTGGHCHRVCLPARAGHPDRGREPVRNLPGAPLPLGVRRPGRGPRRARPAPMAGADSRRAPALPLGQSRPGQRGHRLGRERRVTTSDLGGVPQADRSVAHPFLLGGLNPGGRAGRSAQTAACLLSRSPAAGRNWGCDTAVSSARPVCSVREPSGRPLVAGMNFVLVPGMWLPGSVWEPVTGHLASRGHRTTALTLPGQGDDDPSATLDDQVGRLSRPLTPHPAVWWWSDIRRPAPWPGWRPTGGPTPSGPLCWSVAFRRRTVSRISAPSLPSTVRCRFPAGSPEGPDAADLDQRQRAAFSAQVVAVPEAVTHGTVTAPRPAPVRGTVVLVCPEFAPAEAREWIAAGELAAAARVEFVDINSGHWPMVTRPVELAEILADVADRLTHRT